MTIKSVSFVLAGLLGFMLFSCDSNSPSPAKLKLLSIKKDGEIWREYSYNKNGKLTSYKTYDNAPDYYEFVYYYSSTGEIDSVYKLLNGTDLNVNMVYSYVNSSQIEKIDYYSSDRELYNTATYTYTAGLLTNITNSDQSVQGLKYRDFQYDEQSHLSKISFDFGNSWNYTYYADQEMELPLTFDLIDPLNQIHNPINTFSFVAYSNYTSTYEYGKGNKVATETRNYPDRPDNDPEYPKTEVYTYQYK